MADTTSTASETPANELTLVVGGTALSGWTDVRVTCGIIRCPSDFDIALTDKFPGQASQVVAQDGDTCQVKIGSDVVITGYVDTVETSYDKDSHTIRILGRGKCADLLDCSAEWSTGQISGANALEIAQKLAQPYGITVSAPGAQGPSIPQFNLMLGETAYEIIERVCRFAGLLCYEDVNGNLVLAQAGTEKMASGFVEGKNILAAHSRFSKAERYSEYDCFLLAFNTLQDAGPGGNLPATGHDLDVKRHRKLYVIADAGPGGLPLQQARADWETNRRWGLGQAITVVADSWRDSAGRLWTPNRIVSPVTAPNAKYETGSRRDPPLIAQVTFLRGAEGTRAELELYPPKAFTPEPIVLQPIIPDATAQPPTN